MNQIEDLEAVALFKTSEFKHGFNVREMTRDKNLVYSEAIKAIE